MTDRRFARAARGVAHAGVGGGVAGVWHRIGAPLADLWAAPGGPLDRQLLAGTRFCVIVEEGGFSYGFDADDGYCGWVADTALRPDAPVTHWVASLGTHAYGAPDIKHPGAVPLPMGARLAVTDAEGRFARTDLGFVPAAHLRALGDWLDDPVAVARGFLGVPYLWGGNSRQGIDCSGLVQVARRSCGLPCPPDGDLQSAMPGLDVPEGQEAAGDLVFWKGHVAMVTGPGRVIHANATHMAVTEEDLAVVAARAEGPVIRRLRA